MKKPITFVWIVSLFFLSTLTIAAHPPRLTVQQIQEQRPLALSAYQEGIQKGLDHSWLKNSVFPRKHIVREVTRLTGWEIPNLPEGPEWKEGVVDLELLDIIRDHFSFLGTTYLMLLCALNETQLDEFKQHTHYNVQRPEPSLPQQPKWQKDWSDLHTGLPHQTELLPRMLAIEFLTDPYHVLEGTRYNYVHFREEGMSPELTVQLAQELPWFGTCVEDTLKSVILNQKYSGKNLDMGNMLSVLKEQQPLVKNIKEQVEEMKFEIGDKYVREYLQTVKSDQTDKSLSLVTRVRAEVEVKRLTRQINKIAQYCVATHVSANLLEAYDEQYAAALQ